MNSWIHCKVAFLAAFCPWKAFTSPDVISIVVVSIKLWVGRGTINVFATTDPRRTFNNLVKSHHVKAAEKVSRDGKFAVRTKRISNYCFHRSPTLFKACFKLFTKQQTPLTLWLQLTIVRMHRNFIDTKEHKICPTITRPLNQVQWQLSNTQIYCSSLNGREMSRRVIQVEGKINVCPLWTGNRASRCVVSLLFQVVLCYFGHQFVFYWAYSYIRDFTPRYLAWSILTCCFYHGHRVCHESER